MLMNTGLPSRAVGLVVISMPSTTRPSHVLNGSVILRTSVGFSSASFFMSLV